MTDLSALDQFKPDIEVDDDIAPIHEGYTGVTLAFDQSIANTGWAAIYGANVTEVGNLKTEQKYKGHEDNLQRSMEIFDGINRLIFEFQPDRVVHETPPAGRGMARPESSLLTALAVRLAARMEDIPVIMVSAQKAKKRWTGRAGAKKADVKAALLDLHPYLATMKPMNQAITDAIAIGLLALELENGSK